MYIILNNRLFFLLNDKKDLYLDKFAYRIIFKFNYLNINLIMGHALSKKKIDFNNEDLIDTIESNLDFSSYHNTNNSKMM